MEGKRLGPGNGHKKEYKHLCIPPCPHAYIDTYILICKYTCTKQEQEKLYGLMSTVCYEMRS